MEFSIIRLPFSIERLEYPHARARAALDFAEPIPLCAGQFRESDSIASAVPRRAWSTRFSYAHRDRRKIAVRDLMRKKPLAYFVPDRAVAVQPAFMHLVKHRDFGIDIIINPDSLFVEVQPMKSSCILN
jgi:hypothetical protein